MASSKLTIYSWEGVWWSSVLFRVVRQQKAKNASFAQGYCSFSQFLSPAVCDVFSFFIFLVDFISMLLLFSWNALLLSKALKVVVAIFFAILAPKQSTFSHLTLILRIETVFQWSITVHFRVPHCPLRFLDERFAADVADTIQNALPERCCVSESRWNILWPEQGSPAAADELPPLGVPLRTERKEAGCSVSKGVCCVKHSKKLLLS